MQSPHVIVTVLMLASALGAQQARPTGRISGRVIEQASGAPIPNARVQLVAEGARPQGIPLQTITDTDGRYGFDSVAAGRYTIDVQKAGVVPLKDGANLRQFEIRAGEARDDLTIVMQRSGVITGRIFDTNGEPMVDAPVQAVQAVQAVVPGDAPSPSAPLDDHVSLTPGGNRRDVRTNDLGEFRLFGLTPGEYLVVARTASGTTYYPGVPEAASAQRLRVGSGETVGADFTLFSAPTFNVSGSVTYEDGTPAAEATVILRVDPAQGRGTAAAWFGQNRADDAGQFLLANVPAGEYFVTASLEVRDGSDRRLLADPVAVRVLDGDVQALTIVVR